MEQFKGISKSEDYLNRNGNKQGKFSVNLAYKEFNLSNNQIGCWPWKLIWKVKIPYRDACFTWFLAKVAVLTQDNLIKRGYHLRSRCYLCGEEVEKINLSFFALQIDYTVMEDFHQLKRHHVGYARKNT